MTTLQCSGDEVYRGMQDHGGRGGGGSVRGYRGGGGRQYDDGVDMRRRSGTDECCVMMRGLPYTTTVDMVCSFFSDYDVSWVGVGGGSILRRLELQCVRAHGMQHNITKM